MDLTLKYIKMCEKAWQIQPPEHPVFTIKDSGKIHYRENDIWYCKNLDTSEGKVIKIFRQDQLQEIVEWKDTCRDSIQRHLYELAGRIFNTDDYMSWEEFWLRVVMWEKYGKVWDDEKEEWVDERIIGEDKD